MADTRSLIQKYFPRDQWDNAYKVMMGESGGNHQAIGDNYPINGQTIPSYGLFQIRGLPGRPSAKQLLDPEFNIKYAAGMQASQGWGPWTAARNLGIVGGGKAQPAKNNLATGVLASVKSKMGVADSQQPMQSLGIDQQAYLRMQKMQQAAQYMPYIQQLSDRVQQQQMPQSSPAVDLSPYLAFAQNARNKIAGSYTG